MSEQEIIETTVDGWVLKIREPDNLEGSQVVMLLHGWTGDEDSMWVFSRQIPEDALVIAPRAPYPTKGKDLGGFSWIDKPIDFWPTYRDFLPAVHALHDLIKTQKKQFPTAKFDSMSLVGFSQGSAMAVTYALEFSSYVSRLAVLAGFLPDNVGKNPPETQEFEVFIGHGEKDEIVPVQNAEKTRDYFESAGYEVVYCSAPVEHRLSSECASGLKDFLIK